MLVRRGVAALAALVLAASAALAVLTTLSRRSATEIVALNGALRAVDALRIQLSQSGRERALEYITRDRTIAWERAGDDWDLLRSLASARAAVREPFQRQLLDDAATQIHDFIALRNEIEARSPSADELVRATAPPLDRALATLYAVSGLGFDAVTKADAHLARAQLVENILGIAIATLLLLGFVGIALTLRHLVFAPLLALGLGIDRFAAGDRAARVVPSGANGIRQTAESFNEMAVRLQRQHQDLLTFLAGLAHDLRNPLAAMRLSVRRLQAPLAEENKRKTVDLVDRQITRLERMAGDFLDVTRSESGHLDLEKKRQDVRELVQDAVALNSASSPDHRLLFTPPPAPIDVWCDSERIAQVVNNLILNAIKYSPEGGDIHVSLSATDAEAVISVEDSGIGIAHEDVEHIFEPFRRTGESREAAPGVGLGLSVARQIVVAHGGRIEVQSVPGIGSTFLVRLPRDSPVAAVIPISERNDSHVNGQ